LQGKKIASVDDLSARDKAVLDLLADNTSSKTVAAQFNISRQRVQQIAHHPVSQAYLAKKAGAHRVLLAVRASGELLARMDWGGVKMSDLIALWKAAMPQELAVTLTDKRAEAEAIAAEIGKPELVDQIHQDLLLSQEVKR
jgi:hypothetical protein